MKSDIPRICDIIGVNINQRFIAGDGMGGFVNLIVDGDGEVRYSDSGAIVGGAFLCRILNNPGGICAVPDLTTEEIRLCKMIGANYVSMNEVGTTCDDYVYFWKGLPCKTETFYYGDQEQEIGMLPRHMMPSVKPGQCICVGGSRSK